MIQCRDMPEDTSFSQVKKPRKWLVFIVVATGVFMSTLDSSMVNIALPSIMRTFDSSLHSTEWVVLIYLLTITSTLLFWGHLADRMGRGRFYSLGMLIFAMGSLACALAMSLPLLIVTRLLQAVGAAMMMAIGPAIIRETFPPEQLGRSLGMIGVAVSLGLMSGPAVGGLLIEFYSWRSLFYITVPVGLVFSILGYRILPMHHRIRTGRPDWAGAIFWALTLILASLALTHATSASWSLNLIFSLFMASILTLIVFLKVETISPHPLLSLNLFGRRYFSMGILSAVLSFMTLFSVIMLTPFYLDKVMNLNPSRIGFIMMSVPVSILVVSPLSGWLSDHTSFRLLPTVGLLLASCGLLLLTRISPTSATIDIVFRLALVGGGQAMFLSPNSAAVLSQSPKEKIGTAAALLATARNMGMLLGIAQTGLIFAVLFSRYTSGLDMKDFTPMHTEQFMAALHGAFWGAALTGFAGTLASWSRGTGSRKH